MSRGDVADRAIVVTLRRILDTARRLEAEIERDFERAAPGILAALLDGMVGALHYDRRVPTGLPRMADFAAMACRAAPTFGWKPETVLKALNENREAANIAVVEADPLSDALRHILHEHGRSYDGGKLWEGTASELLEHANAAAPDPVKRERGWPKDATRLSARLRRLAPALRRCGIDVTLPEGEEGRGAEYPFFSVPRVPSVPSRKTPQKRRTPPNITAFPQRSMKTMFSVPKRARAFRSVPLTH